MGSENKGKDFYISDNHGNGAAQELNSLVVQGTWVLSLVRELHPTCPNKDLAQPDK